MLARLYSSLRHAQIMPRRPLTDGRTYDSGVLSPFGQALLTDAYQDGPIVCHHYHAHLHHRAVKTLVTQGARATRHQGRDVTLHHRATIATGTGQLNLIRGADT